MGTAHVCSFHNKTRETYESDLSFTSLETVSFSHLLAGLRDEAENFIFPALGVGPIDA